MFLVATVDPIPAKSSSLYVPQVANIGPNKNSSGEPPDMLSYRDAMALWQAHGASHQTLVYPAKWGVESNNPLVPSRFQVLRDRYTHMLEQRNSCPRLNLFAEKRWCTAPIT